MVYTANWGIICHLPPFTGTRNNHWCTVAQLDKDTAWVWYSTLLLRWAQVMPATFVIWNILTSWPNWTRSNGCCCRNLSETLGKQVMLYVYIIYIYINIFILYSLLFVETSFSGHCDLQHYPLSIIDLYCKHVYLIIIIIIIRLWSICMYSPLFKPPIIVYGHSIASCTCPDRRHDIKLS